MSTKPQKSLDPRREEMVYGKTFTGVVNMNKYLRPKTGSDIKEATLGKGTFGLVTLATRIADDKRVALKLLQNPPDDPKSRPQQGVCITADEQGGNSGTV